jgi:DNA-directed RNA polymerase specialized sigma24 family protein
LVKDFYKTKKDEINIDEIFNLWIENNFWDNIDDKNKLEEVIDFLKSLKVEKREILIMRIWNDLSYKEISEITWKSVDNCKKITSRVLKDINTNLAIFILLIII